MGQGERDLDKKPHDVLLEAINEMLNQIRGSRDRRDRRPIKNVREVENGQEQGQYGRRDRRRRHLSVRLRICSLRPGPDQRVAGPPLAAIAVGAEAAQQSGARFCFDGSQQKEKWQVRSQTI